MRPLVLAAILAALAGCSLPYVGTSFKALPKPEHRAEGERRETNDHEATAEGEKQVHTGAIMYNGDADDVFPPAPKGPLDRTGAAFPSTAQPG